MLNWNTFLTAALLLAPHAAADEIYLRDGRVFHGEVTEYVNGVLRLRTAEDDDSVVAMNLVARIEFEPSGSEPQAVNRPPGPAISETLAALIEQTEKKLQAGGQGSAAIAMCLETEAGEPVTTQRTAEYRCYRGYGYSGIVPAPIGAPWVRVERVRENDDGVRRVMIDAGPPYAVVNRTVTLIPGKVTNLGRVVLPRVEASGTVSLSGHVRDLDGAPVEGAQVTAGTRQAVTDADGFYRLDGFGLEVVDLKAHKRGYADGAARVSIRDTNKSEIACDLAVFRPRRLKLSYVISAEGSRSFVGAGVESGVIEKVIDSPRESLHETIQSSKSFQRFANDAYLKLGLKNGGLVIQNFYAPIFYQLAEADVDFADLEEVGELPSDAQHCPPLTEGAVVVACGLGRDRGRGVSPYCVKFLVEELSIVDGEDEGQQSDPER